MTNIAFKRREEVVTVETEIDAKADPSEVLAAMRLGKITGQVTFHLGQGGVQRLVLVEKKKQGA